MSCERTEHSDFDAIIIGGGFYGVIIALYLANQRNLRKVLLLEKESTLMARASYNNQARVHNGYHYPRSFTTAYRSRLNSPKFLHDWPQAITNNFTKLYAIARRNSKVTSTQFERFCKNIGAKIQPADQCHTKLFEPRLIESVYQVEENAFDATILAAWATQKLRESGVLVEFDTRVTEIVKSLTAPLQVVAEKKEFTRRSITSRFVFNCTYSGLNQFEGDFPGISSPLKQEITEMALVNVPSELSELGITIMDGPFFSMMPFPARGLHTLSHVRYTPHMSWADQQGTDPYLKLLTYAKQSRADRMIRDISRYVPSAEKTKYEESLFEIKTVLAKNEIDDGRPIFFEHHINLPGCYSVMGGKIDNIYDVIERLENEISLF